MGSKVIFINPGHDLSLDPGAVNDYLNITEAEICAEIGALVADNIQDSGYTAIVMQDDNLAGEGTYSYKYSVCGQANVNKADLFISLHCNSFCNENANGSECFVFDYGGEAEKCAKYIQESLVYNLGTTNRGVKKANFSVLKNTFMPAVLVEIAFISNYDEALMLRDRQDEIAEAIANGIVEYLEDV